jgi:hypothetical protein
VREIKVDPPSNMFKKLVIKNAIKMYPPQKMFTSLLYPPSEIGKKYHGSSPWVFKPYS